MKILPTLLPPICSVLSFALCCHGLGADDAQPPKPRRYEQGPLRVEEFRGKVDENSPGSASTQTRVMINYGYEVTAEDNRFAAQLTTIEVFAVFLPKDSWWRFPDDPRLLDHEQGHFDIAEIAARRLQLAFDSLAVDSSVSGRGDSQQQATKAMEAKLRKIMQLVNEQAVDENKEYDRITAHGMKRRAQFEQRRLQRLTLQRLEKQLKKKSDRAQPRTRSSVLANEE